MVNLLPPEERRILRQTKNLKQIVISILMVFCALVCLVLVLFTVKIDLESRLKFEKVVLAQRKQEFQSSEREDSERKIIFFNQISSNADSFFRQKADVVGILEELSGMRPSDITFASFSYRNVSRKISIIGFSPDRESLLEFKKKLEEKDEFQDVLFPPSVWIKPVDIDFSVSFTIQ